MWGAGTMVRQAQGWRYIHVRRLFIFIEESIRQGTQWVVFEPNDGDLWARVRRTVASFLRGLWMQGALVGATPEQAFFILCDETNNPPSSVDEGKLVVDIGVAPVKPAEFVIFRISQWQGGAATAEGMEEWDMPDLAPRFIFVLEIDSGEKGRFRQGAGVESQTETI